MNFNKVTFKDNNGVCFRFEGCELYNLPLENQRFSCPKDQFPTSIESKVDAVKSYLNTAYNLKLRRSNFKQQSVLIQTIKYKNYELVDYISSNLLKWINSGQSQPSSGPALYKAVILYLEAESSKKELLFKIINILIDHGADVNLPSREVVEFPRLQKKFVKSPLFEAVTAQDLPLTILLLENGAKKFYAYNGCGIGVIGAANKGCKNLSYVIKAVNHLPIIKQKFSNEGEKTYHKAKTQIKVLMREKKFTFFLGLFDPLSMIAPLPRDVMHYILNFCKPKPSSNDGLVNGGYNKINTAISKVAEKELLFLLGQADSNSILYNLPRRIQTEILRRSIALR